MAIRNPFKDKYLQATFDSAIQMFEARHRDLFSSKGQPHRLNGYASPFWRGYFGEPQALVVKGTPGYAMFRAGQACKREFGIEFQQDGKFIPIGAERHYPPTGQ